MNEILQPSHTLLWNWDPATLIGLLTLSVAYALEVGPLRQNLGLGQPVSCTRQSAFYLGVAVLFVAFVSPLDEVADTQLFSAHMIQHMLLMFVVAPLWLIGVPGWLVARLFPVGQARKLFRRLTNPLAAFVIFNGVMWLWHLPVLYDAALSNAELHLVEHGLFLVAAFIGWFPVVGNPPDRQRTLSAPLRAVYLAVSMLPCTALAALITLSPRLLYRFYGRAPLTWGLNPHVDQMLGGLVMWLPGDMIFMATAIIVVAAWLYRAPPDPESQQISDLSLRRGPTS